MTGHGELAREGGEGEGKRERGARMGLCHGVGGMGRGCQEQLGPTALCRFSVWDCLLYVREESTKEKVKGVEKQKEGKEMKKQKKYEKISNLKISEK
jgi:hypothetical protein